MLIVNLLVFLSAGVIEIAISPCLLMNGRGDVGGVYWHILSWLRGRVATHTVGSGSFFAKNVLRTKHVVVPHFHGFLQVSSFISNKQLIDHVVRDD